MPSKTKKSSKAQSKLPNGDHSSSPQTPSLIPSLSFELTEDSLASSLEEASTKYPSLISKSAFIGKLVDVERNSRGCKIWLSEPSMLASSLAPGSIVSVIPQKIEYVVCDCVIFIVICFNVVARCHLLRGRDFRRVSH